MAGLRRTVHPVANFAWQKLRLLAPDVSFETNPAVAAANGAEPEEPMGLAFVDPDGETHIYVFNDDGRVKLIRDLTGGVILPN